IHYWMTAATNPTDADTTNILFTKLNSVFDIGSVKYNGTTFTLVGEQSLTADTTVTTYEGHSIAFKLKPEPSFTEQLVVVEQIKIAVDKPIAKQQLSISDTITVAQRLTRGLATEQLALTVSLTKAAVLSRPIAIQQLGFSDNVSSTELLARQLSEQLTVAAN